MPLTGFRWRIQPKFWLLRPLSTLPPVRSWYEFFFTLSLILFLLFQNQEIYFTSNYVCISTFILIHNPSLQKIFSIVPAEIPLWLLLALKWLVLLILESLLSSLAYVLYFEVIKIIVLGRLRKSFVGDSKRLKYFDAATTLVRNYILTWAFQEPLS